MNILYQDCEILKEKKIEKFNPFTPTDDFKVDPIQWMEESTQC